MGRVREVEEACAVFAVSGAETDATFVTVQALHALQHRGQESAGIAVADRGGLRVHKANGLVSEVFDEHVLERLRGVDAIGHTRYSTVGGSSVEHAQPMAARRPDGDRFAIAHNGTLTNTAALAARGRRPHAGRTDSQVLAAVLGAEEGTLTDALARLLPTVDGAFSVVLLDRYAVYGARDRHGLRPLSIGRLHGGGLVLASETVAFDAVGAEFVRDVEPGEIVTLHGDMVRSRRFATASPALCAFEYVYFARPDSSLEGRRVHLVRRALGEALAREAQAPADVVVAVPDSALSAAEGYARASGLPLEFGLARNRYIGRTFIQPTQRRRVAAVRSKLNPVRELVAGKRLAVVDDSLVRGTTMASVVDMLRAAGAAEVHVRISSPPVYWPCYYGIDLPSQDELIANRFDAKQLTDRIGADSLAHLSVPGMAEVLAFSRGTCTGCFTGRYPAGSAPAGTGHPELLEESELWAVQGRAAVS